MSNQSRQSPVKIRAPRGAFVERLTKNELFLKRDGSMRYDDVLAELELHNHDASKAIQSMKRCLSIDENKIDFLRLHSVVVCVVPWAADGGGRDESGKSFRCWNVTDMRDSFSTLRVYGDEDQLSLLDEWKIDSLWALRSFTMSVSHGVKSFCVSSPANLLNVGPLYEVMRCLGKGMDGRPCRKPVDPSYHDQYCDGCTSRATKNAKRGSAEVRILLQKRDSRRAALDPFAKECLNSAGSEVDNEVGSPCGKKRRIETKTIRVPDQRTSPELRVREESEPEARCDPDKPAIASDRSSTLSEQLVEIAAELNQYVKIDPHKRKHPSIERVLEGITVKLEALCRTVTGADLCHESLKSASFLTNLCIAASDARHSETGIRLRALKSLLILKGKKYAKDVGKGSEETNKAAESSFMSSAFQNLDRIAKGEEPIELPSDALVIKKDVKPSKPAPRPRKTDNSAFTATFASEEEVKASLEACLAKRSSIDHLL